MTEYVVIKDMSAGNEVVGEMWQETKIFNSDTTIEEVMEWAIGHQKDYSTKNIKLTLPDNSRG